MECISGAWDETDNRKTKAEIEREIRKTNMFRNGLQIPDIWYVDRFWEQLCDSTIFHHLRFAFAF